MFINDQTDIKGIINSTLLSIIEAETIYTRRSKPVQLLHAFVTLLARLLVIPGRNLFES